MCTACVRSPQAVNATQKSVDIANVVDAHIEWRFEIERDHVHTVGKDWTKWEPIANAMYCRRMIVMEVVAQVIGSSPDDVAIVGNSLEIRLLDNGSAPVFERPLNFLTIGIRQANAEQDARIARLERMMNVLVEQDSPAGEALRRLGGAKIEHSSLTKLARPEIYEKHDTYFLRATVVDQFRLTSDVSVRLSLLGIKQYDVS
jgi:hypothetical protein